MDVSYTLLMRIYILSPQCSIKSFLGCWIPCLYSVCTQPQTYALVSNLNIYQSKRYVNKRKKTKIRVPKRWPLYACLFFLRCGPHVAQDGPELLGLSDPPTSAFQIAGTIGVLIMHSL